MFFRDYFIRREAQKLRSNELLRSMQEIKRSFKQVKAEILEVSSDKHKFAYLLAEKEGFSGSPEEYWLKAESSINGMLEWLTKYEEDHKETLKTTRMLIRKQI